MSDFESSIREMQQKIIKQAREQYSEAVVEHWLNPRNLYPMQEADGYARLKGQCGDTMEIYVQIQKERIIKASFLTDGCITSIASGSMAVELDNGKSLSDAWDISKDDILKKLGGLPEESQHCAFLATSTLRAAIDNYMSKGPIGLEENLPPGFK